MVVVDGVLTAEDGVDLVIVVGGKLLVCTILVVVSIADGMGPSFDMYVSLEWGKEEVTGEEGGEGVGDLGQGGGGI